MSDKHYINYKMVLSNGQEYLFDTLSDLEEYEKENDLHGFRIEIVVQ